MDIARFRRATSHSNLRSQSCFRHNSVPLRRIWTHMHLCRNQGPVCTTRSILMRSNYDNKGRNNITSSHSSISSTRYRKSLGKQYPRQVIGLTSTQSETPFAAIECNNPLPSYQVPTTGFTSYLPRSWVPYAELMRLDKPAGTYYLFFPCLFSTLMAASYTSAAPLQVILTTSCFFSGALIMRGAGCTINDLWDRNLDPHVARTRLRPIARRAVTSFQALTFTGFELLAGLGILLQFPTSCLYYGIPSLLLVATYPLAKRVTHYPQFVLGLTFSWGAIMGFPALGVDLLADASAVKGVAALYASCASWTVLYDMIYAHMDIKDDVKVGIKSIALRHEKDTKAVLSGLAVVQICLLAAAGIATGVGPIFFVGSCGSAAATLSLMIWKVKLKEVSSCWWWFKNGGLFTGGGIAIGMLAEYLFVSHSQSTQLEYNVLEEKPDG